MFDDQEIQQSQSTKTKVQEETHIELPASVTLDFIITVAGDIQGTIIDEELWEATASKVAFDALEDQHKSSRYWIEVPYLGGEVILSDKKMWHKEFAREETKGRTDFGVRLRKEAEISCEL